MAATSLMHYQHAAGLQPPCAVRQFTVACPGSRSRGTSGDREAAEPRHLGVG